MSFDIGNMASLVKVMAWLNKYRDNDWFVRRRAQWSNIDNNIKTDQS